MRTNRPLEQIAMIGTLVVRYIPARASRAAAPLLLAALVGSANVENLDGFAAVSALSAPRRFLALQY